MVWECFLCHRKCKSSKGFENVGLGTVIHSQKPIKYVINHIAKNMKIQLNIPPDSWVCNKCFQDLIQYDELVVKLLVVQQRLTRLIKKENTKSLNETENFKIKDINNSPNMDIIHSMQLEDEQVAEEFFDLTDCKNLSELDASNLDSIDKDDDHVDIMQESVILEAGESNDMPHKLHSCEHCEKTFKNKTRLKYHIDHEHKRKDCCKCTECGVEVRDEEYLELHMNIHDGKSEMECRYCSKRYTRKVNVIRHMQKHWDKKKFQCEKCGLRFSETTLLYNHKLQHDAEEQPLICHVCSQSFKTKRTYKGHMLTHQPDRPRFHCQYCAKTFVEKYTLKVHLRVHENSTAEVEKRSNDDTKTLFTCIICDCRFTSRDQHNQHMQKQHDVILKSNIFVQ